MDPVLTQLNAAAQLIKPQADAAYAAAKPTLDAAYESAYAAVAPALEVAHPHIAKAVDLIESKWEQLAGPVHPYSEDFVMMSPVYPLICMAVYLFFVLAVAPFFKAINFKVSLKPLMRLYNLFMVVLSFYMGTMSLYLASQSNSSIFCVPLATGDAGSAMAILSWIFTYSKVIEFLDTIFMIFEGRWRQVSFLHVYHHISILSYWYSILWMHPGSDGYFSLALNSYIHVMMYGYYLLASFGYQPWWKFYITYCQLLQFCVFCCQSIYVGYIKKPEECAFPNILAKGLFWYMVSLISLFLNFLIINKFKKGSGKKKAPAAGGAEKKNA